VGVLAAGLLVLTGGVLVSASAAPVGVPPSGEGGNVVGWGNNTYGQTNAPAPPTGQHYTAIAAGFEHSLALTNRGVVVAWGDNTHGQTNVPAPPPGEHYTAIAAGNDDSLALTDQGTVVGWGNDEYGKADPPAPPTGEHFTAIAAGYVHSLALTDQGTLVPWGSNAYGQNAVPAPPDDEHFTAISSYFDDLAMTDQGTVISWGYNSYGLSNVPAPPTGEHYTAISAGYLHSLALTDQGTVVGWGNTDAGATDVPAPPTGQHYTAIAAGFHISLALTDQGAVVGWGYDGEGQTDAPALPTGGHYTAIAANYSSLGITPPVPPAVSGISSGSGPVAGGDQLTITGSGFTGATVVTFDGIPATTLTVDSPTRITATTPARRAGIVNVRVTTPVGRSPILTADHYVFRPVPTVTSLSPTEGRLSGGKTLRITGTGFAGATEVHIGDTPATSFRIYSTKRIVAVVPASPDGEATNVPVTVTTSGGTNTTSQAGYDYRAAPTVTGVSPAAGTTAGGQSVTVTGTGFTRASKVTFDAINATRYTVDSDTQITATSPARRAGIVNVRVTTVGGTSPMVAGDHYRYR
jgi:hypothetical protein